MAKELIDGGETHDLASRLNAAFMTLPPETRAALWLHLVDGEDIAEVADTLELSPAAVERLIRERLRELRQFAMGCGLFLPLPRVQTSSALGW